MALFLTLSPFASLAAQAVLSRARTALCATAANRTPRSND
jgi:hypothetical protein